MSATTPHLDCSSLLSPETPVHHCSSATRSYGPDYENRNATFSRLALEMGPFFVGPIPAPAFLDSFMPPPSAGSPPFMPKMFSDLTGLLGRPEIESYKLEVFLSSDPKSTSTPLLRSNPIFPDQNYCSASHKVSRSQHIPLARHITH